MPDQIDETYFRLLPTGASEITAKEAAGTRLCLRRGWRAGSGAADVSSCQGFSGK